MGGESRKTFSSSPKLTGGGVLMVDRVQKCANGKDRVNTTVIEQALCDGEGEVVFSGMAG